jgi:hypothetical protein
MHAAWTAEVKKSPHATANRERNLLPEIINSEN